MEHGDWIKLGDLNFEKESYDNAANYYTKAIELKGDIAEYYLKRSKVYLKQRKKLIDKYEECVYYSEQDIDKSCKPVSHHGVYRDYNYANELLKNATNDEILYYKIQLETNRQLEKYEDAVKDCENLISCNFNNDVYQKEIDELKKKIEEDKLINKIFATIVKPELKINPVTTKINYKKSIEQLSFIEPVQENTISMKSTNSCTVFPTTNINNTDLILVIDGK